MQKRNRKSTVKLAMMLMIALSAIQGSKAQYIVTEADLKHANNAYRQRDSCAAAGFLLSVTTKGLEKENKILSDSAKIKYQENQKLAQKLKNKNKTLIGSLLVNAIFFAILIFK